MKIKNKPIGMVRTPFQNLQGIPNQPSTSNGEHGIVEIYSEFQQGLRDLHILDNIPVLDIKPYFREFDPNKEIKAGWI